MSSYRRPLMTGAPPVKSLLQSETILLDFSACSSASVMSATLFRENLDDSGLYVGKLARNSMASARSFMLSSMVRMSFSVSSTSPSRSLAAAESSALLAALLATATSRWSPAASAWPSCRSCMAWVAEISASSRRVLARSFSRSAMRWSHPSPRSAYIRDRPIGASLQ